jgi:hypothetical protein
MATAWAYEVDAWTPRGVAVDDSAWMASRVFESVLDEALAEVRAHCPADPEARKRRVAREVARASARRVRLDRPGLSAFGNGVFSAWLEVDPLVDRVTTGTDGVFAEVTPRDSVILSLAGTASTVRFGDVLLGTDKVDHFLATGFQYARWSRWGEVPERAVRRGTRTERRFYGQLTSRTFSYADLAANWDGYRFYAGLLEEGSVVQPDADQCVVRVGSWDWTVWADPSWDEFANPSVYSARVQRRLEDRLEGDREAVCEAWTPGEPVGPWLGKVPVPQGPLGLEGWCTVAADSESVAR